MRKFRIKKGYADYQVGNFIYHEEADHVKVSAVGGVFTSRVSKLIAKGRQLSLYLEEARKGDVNAVKALEMHGVAMFNVMCTVVDVQFLSEVSEASVACMERHKDIYGVKDEVTEESEREDIEAVKATEAFDAEIRSKIAEEEGIDE